MLYVQLALAALIGTANAQNAVDNNPEKPAALPAANNEMEASKEEDSSEENPQQPKKEDKGPDLLTPELKRQAIAAFRTANPPKQTDDEAKGPKPDRKGGKRSYTVHLFPDGSPMFPIPSDVAERDTVKFVIWSTEEHINQYAVSVTDCTKVDPLRINGEQRDGIDPEAGNYKMVSLDLGLDLRCGEGVAEVKITGPEISTGYGAVSESFKINFAATYAMSAAVGLVYDASPTNALELSPGAALEDGTAQYKLGRSDAQLGIQRTALLMLHPLGYTPGRITAGSVLLNPTLGISLSEKVFTEAYLGNSVGIPGVPGLWVTGGYHLQQLERPTSASGVEVGDLTTSASPSAIATETVWTGASENGGWYLGLSFDLATFSRLAKMEEKQKGDTQQDSGDDEQQSDQ